MQDVDDGTKGEMVTGWGVDIRREAVGMIRRNRAGNCVRVRIRFASRKEGQTTKFFALGLRTEEIRANSQSIVGGVFTDAG